MIHLRFSTWQETTALNWLIKASLPPSCGGKRRRRSCYRLRRHRQGRQGLSDLGSDSILEQAGRGFETQLKLRDAYG